MPSPLFSFSSGLVLTAMLCDSVWDKYCACWNNDQTPCIQRGCIQSGTELHPVPSLGMQFGHGRDEPMGMWYPRIPYTWRNNLNSSFSGVVNSRGVACMQLLFGHSPVSGVTQLMQSGGRRWSNRAHASPVHLHLGYLAVCLPCCIYCWWLFREKQLLCSVSGTPEMLRRWS